MRRIAALLFLALVPAAPRRAAAARAEARAPLSAEEKAFCEDEVGVVVRFQGRRTEPTCESEEIQQYVRFVK